MIRYKLCVIFDKPSIWTVMTRMDGGKNHCTPPTGKYKRRLKADLDQSIHPSCKECSNYINRALARFHQNNLRGAMVTVVWLWIFSPR